MNISLLDIAWPGRPYNRTKRFEHVIQQVKDTVAPDNSVADSVAAAPDSVVAAPDAMTDSLSQINLLNGMPGDGSSLWLPLAVVVVALAVCVALAVAYSKHNVLAGK